MCLSSFFQFPLFIIACVNELQTTNITSSNPQDMVNAGTTPLPSLLLLLGCLFLVLGVITPEAFASPIGNAEPHHHHTRPWVAWHRTAHVRRDIITPITAGAELPDILNWAIDDDVPGFAMKWVPGPAKEISPALRLPRGLLARMYECWKGGKLWSCVMHIIKAGEEANSSP
jgi:hypothetical protein